MLTLTELNKAMKLNELLTIKELRRKDKSNLKRLLELNLHRTLLKDCIIERLSTIVEELSTKIKSETSIIKKVA